MADTPRYETLCDHFGMNATTAVAVTTSTLTSLANAAFVHHEKGPIALTVCALTGAAYGFLSWVGGALAEKRLIADFRRRNVSSKTGSRIVKSAGVAGFVLTNAFYQLHLSTFYSGTGKTPPEETSAEQVPPPKKSLESKGLRP